VRPRRYTDLLEGLPGIPTNVLSTRLKELEQSGVIERRVAPAPQRGVLYALTPVGQALEPAILTLGRWGAAQLVDPQPGEIVTPESVTMTLRAVFNPGAAAGLTASWEVHAGDIVLYLVVTEGKLDAGVGPVPGGPDLTITFQPEPGDLPSYQSLIQAAKCGLVTLDGSRDLLQAFLDVFTAPRPA
jgi:DNA-binding HxlR family transcriptional regulator